MRNLLFICLLLSSLSSEAQSDIRVMCYNVLNFPQGFMPDREDTLKKIVEYVEPDLLLIQELKSELGLQMILEESFADVPGSFASAEYVSQQSNQGTSWPLQQALIYNTDVFGLAEERLKITPVRDINIYKLFLQDQELAMGADTTYMYVFVTHLKSSQGDNNEQLRLESAEVFTTELANIPSDSYVLFGGDFNVYSSNEPAYQEILANDNAIVMEDPIDAPGSWTSSSYPFKEILTQSTRVSEIYGDGAGGGLDDRFDFILCSANMKDPSSPVRVDIDSYKALGNNGDCYNLNITQCDENNEVPYGILLAMYYMSDHLPVVMDIDLDLTLGQPEIASTPSASIKWNQQELWIEGHTGNGNIEVYSALGSLVGNFNLPYGQRVLLQGMRPGMYIVRFRDSENNQIISEKIYLK
ncbi:MAG: T9SS type A sorting domain-containing protein [Flavobacteriales bacterium]|nr:T9SS type A sorting domain-containing protein [Flavobacteriales bacterium]